MLSLSHNDYWNVLDLSGIAYGGIRLRQFGTEMGANLPKLFSSTDGGKGSEQCSL